MFQVLLWTYVNPLNCENIFLFKAIVTSCEPGLSYMVQAVYDTYDIDVVNVPSEDIGLCRFIFIGT